MSQNFYFFSTVNRGPLWLRVTTDTSSECCDDLVLGMRNGRFYSLQPDSCRLALRLSDLQSWDDMLINHIQWMVKRGCHKNKIKINTLNGSNNDQQTLPSVATLIWYSDPIANFRNRLCCWTLYAYWSYFAIPEILIDCLKLLVKIF